MRPAAAPSLRAAAAGAGVATAAWHLMTRRPPGGPARWRRRNHRGHPVTLLEGPACALGALASVAAAPGLLPCVRRAALLCGTAAAAVGCYDDLSGASTPKGFAGHVGALARGEVTSGVVKIVGVGAAGLGAGALVRSDPFDAVLTGGVVAGAANLLNLLDLRPGRAGKAALAAGLPAVLTGGPAAPAVAAGLGAAMALLPADLAERGMLGDTGANALGAILGLGLAATASRRRLGATLVALVALTAVSEAVSFSRVIDTVAPLRWLDRLGRR